MGWKIYNVTYTLKSPLHIGYHKVGSVQRTRYYIPTRNLWGAVTEVLTRGGFATEVLNSSQPDDYQAVGNWVNTHCAFGYWFIKENSVSLSPHYENGALKYGRYPVAEFERCYLNAHITTALDASTTSAADGTLHEVEFIAPYNSDSTPTQIGGLVFLDEEAQCHLGKEDNWRAWLENLQVGGERRYGFGRLQCINFKEDNKIEDGYFLSLEDPRPQITVPKGKPLLAHAAVKDIKAKGQIEPLVWRTTFSSNRFGTDLTYASICWIPGSIVTEDVEIKVTEDGYWMALKNDNTSG